MFLNKVPTNNSPPYYYSEEENDKDKDDEDDGNDYYFSLPSIITPMSAVDFFAAMGVMQEFEDVITDFDTQETISAEVVKVQEEDVMYVEA